MSNLVIVAIPDENDRVWKVSSEKVPHLTLLYLGDAAQVQNLQSIVEYVGHAANTTMNRFYLSVDKRGELGADQADVLFFRRSRYSGYGEIRDFRMNLLKDPNIRTAYDSSTQWDGPWQPHLTLGYPSQPAKPDKDDYGFYDVSFTKIAVWVDDYDGPEFELGDYWDEVDAAEAAPLDVAMSELVRHDIGGLRVLDEEVVDLDELGAEFLVHQGLMTPDEYLEHFGTKGMKWGVRKVKEGAKKVGRGVGKAADALGEHFYETSVYSEVKHEAVHNEVSRNLDKKLYLLADAPKYRGKNLKTDHALKTEYEQDVAKVTDAAYRRAVKKVYGENTKGTKEARYVEDARGARIEIRNKQTGEKLREADITSMQEIQANKLDEARHAAADVPEVPDITIKLKLDDNGFVVGLGLLESSKSELAQSSDLGLAFLVDLGIIDKDKVQHYGVKGMRWGQRKAAPEAITPVAVSKVPHGDKRKTKIDVEGGENHDAAPEALKVAQHKAKLKKSGTAALTNQELREIAQREQLEQQVQQLTASPGKRFVTNFFKNQGTQSAERVVRKKAMSKGF